MITVVSCPWRSTRSIASREKAKVLSQTGFSVRCVARPTLGSVGSLKLEKAKGKEKAKATGVSRLREMTTRTNEIPVKFVERRTTPLKIASRGIRTKMAEVKGSRLPARRLTGGTSSPGGAGTVMALSRSEIDTSPETELRTTTTGVRSVTARGQVSWTQGQMSTSAQPRLPPGFLQNSWRELLDLGMLKGPRSSMNLRPGLLSWS